jgi:Arc/MetJ-type ribon-helix-helix transcriptional regulator
MSVEESEKKMKIITVNLPVPYIKTIENLVGDKGLFPNRSEALRYFINTGKKAFTDSLNVPLNINTLNNHVIELDRAILEYLAHRDTVFNMIVKRKGKLGNMTRMLDEFSKFLESQNNDGGF